MEDLVASGSLEEVYLKHVSGDSTTMEADDHA
jgi:hypothetical protein